MYLAQGPLPTQADLTGDKALCEYDFRVDWRYNAYNIILTVLTPQRRNPARRRRE